MKTNNSLTVRVGKIKLQIVKFHIFHMIVLQELENIQNIKTHWFVFTSAVLHKSGCGNFMIFLVCHDFVIKRNVGITCFITIIVKYQDIKTFPILCSSVPLAVFFH